MAPPRNASSHAPTTAETGEFVARHIGPDDAAVAHMLRTVGHASLESLMSAAVPGGIRTAAALDLPEPLDEEATARAYTYSWRTLTDDRAAARQLLVAPVVDRYDRTMAGLAPGARRDHRVVTASVVGSGAVHAATTCARVLVFVNQRTTADALDEPRTDLDRVLVSLTRVDGLWRVSELDAL